MGVVKLESSAGTKEEAPGWGFFSRRYPLVSSYISNCLQDSSLHGVKYMAWSSLNVIERIFWGAAFLACFGFGVYMVLDTLGRFYTSPVIISFQPKETPVASIPFPAITICNVNLLKNSVLNQINKNLTEEIRVIKASGKYVGKPPSEFPLNLLNGIIILDHLTQFCLAAPSFRRRTGQQLLDSMGEPDAITGVQTSLTNISDDAFNKFLYGDYQKNITDEVERIFSEATMNCQNLIVSCLWAENPIPCKDFFFQIDTRGGRCCVFNMMPKYILQNISLEERRAEREYKNLPDEAKTGWKEFAKRPVIIDKGPTSRMNNSDYPKFQMAGGKPFGLSILLNPNLMDYSTCTVNDGPGFKLVAHSSVSLPSIMEYSAAIPLNSEVFIDIEPHVTFSDRGMLNGIEIDKRGCYLPTDKPAKLKHFNFYSSENCISECLAEYTQQNCSCVTHFMPRNSSQLICGANRRTCVDNLRLIVATSKGRKSYCPECLPPCTEVKYKLQMSQFHLRDNDASTYFNNSEGVGQNVSNYSIVHMYFGTDSIYAKERKRLFQWSDLIANAGGLLSLGLGMSILSLVELVYFITLRAWFQIRSFRNHNSSKGKGDQDENGK